MFFVLHVLELDDPVLHTVSPRQEHIVLASTQVLDKHCSWTDDGIRDVRKMPGKSRRQKPPIPRTLPTVMVEEKICSAISDRFGVSARESFGGKS